MKRLTSIAGVWLMAARVFGDGTPVAPATQTEVNQGTIKTKYVSPATLAGNVGTNAGLPKANGYGTNLTIYGTLTADKLVATNVIAVQSNTTPSRLTMLSNAPLENTNGFIGGAFTGYGTNLHGIMYDGTDPAGNVPQTNWVVTQINNAIAATPTVSATVSNGATSLVLTNPLSSPVGYNIGYSPQVLFSVDTNIIFVYTTNTTPPGTGASRKHFGAYLWSRGVGAYTNYADSTLTISNVGNCWALKRTAAINWVLTNESPIGQYYSYNGGLVGIFTAFSTPRYCPILTQVSGGAPIAADFALNTYYTNGSSPIRIFESFQLSCAAGSISTVALYTDQTDTGVWNQTGMSISAGAAGETTNILQLSGYIMPNGRFMFTNTVGTASVVSNSTEIVVQ